MLAEGGPPRGLAQRLVPRQRQRLPVLQGRSSLSVSRTHYVLGRPEPPLLLSWDIREEVAPGDWIGLYRTDETDPLHFLEHKNKPCLSGNSKGQVLWNIDCQEAFTSETTNVCFRYYHGTTGTLRAVSPVVTVCRSADTTGTVNGHTSDIIVGYSSQQIPTEMVKFYLTNLHGRNLKKGMFFSPEPYVKMCIQPGLGDGVLLLPHHGQVCRTGPAEATVNPSWLGQFEFIAYPSDMLELEVKDKFARSRPLVSRFLGRLGVHIWDLLEHTSGSGPVELSYNLANKSPSDHVSGQIFFTFVLEHGPVDPWTHIRQVHNPIYVSDIPDRCCPSPPPPPPPSSSPEPPPPPPSPTPPPPPQQPPITTARTTSLPGNANPPSTSSSSSSCSSTSGTDYPEPNPRRRSMRSNSEHGLHSPAAAPQAAARRLSQTSRSCQGATAQGGSAFANLEYILQGGRASQAAMDLPPPLPPKQKGAKHRPLERLHALGSADEVPSTSWKHARRRQRDPPECEVPAPSDSDDSSASASPIAGDSSPPPTLPRRTRPVVLHVGTDGSRPAPLATPEQDSLHEVGGAPSSLENLSGVLDALESEDEVSAAEESVQECDRVNSEPANLEFDSRGVRNSTSPVVSSSEEASTLSASEDEDSAMRRRHPSEQRCHSDSECSLAKPRRQHNRHNRNQSRVRAHGQRESTCAGMLMPYSRSDHSSLVLTTARECTLGSPEGDRPPPVVHVRRMQPSPMGDNYQNGGGLIGSECPSLASCSATSSGPSTVEPSPTSSGVTPGGQQQHASTTRLPSIPERTIRYQRVELDEPLPSHWEARIDSHGRIFYIDHLNRTTTWNRPSASQSTTSGPSNELQRQQFDRRYQSIRRTMTARLAAPVVASAPPAAEEIVPTAPPPVPSPDGQRSLLRLPAVRFIMRSDFFNVLHMNDDALAAYNRSSSLKHMIAKIRRDSSNFERYQHNRDLVSLLNKFADKGRDLPRGWETKLDRCGKQFFIDHTSRSTTFIDPRLPVDMPYVNPSKLAVPLVRRRSRSAGEDKTSRSGAGGGCARGGPVPPPRPPSSTSGAAMASATPVPTAYNDKVVAFLRQPNILDILRERHPAIASNAGLRDRVHCIRAEGTSALGRLSHDLDLTILLSLFEQEIMSYVPAQYSGSGSSHRSPRDSPQPSPQASPGLQRANVRAPAPYRRDFEAKLRNFYRKLESKGYGQGPSKLKLNIRRDHLLEDAFMKIMAASKKDLQKSRLYIGFAGEEGLDYGGPSREFFFLLSRELFNPYYGLFEYSANDTYTVQVSPMSAFVDNQHEWFRFSGRVLGLALVHQYLLDAFFTRPFYKALLRLPCSLSDLEYLDAEFHQSLLWLKENDITDMGLELTFSVVEDVAGHVIEKELKQGGKSISVTERNKKEYIERMLKWRLERGVSEQTECLVRGFYEVVDSRLVAVFDARELELVIAGTAEIDIADWRKNTEYRSGYHDSHPVIQWFWMAIERFDNERRLRLLQFVTGTSSIPYEGFAALRGSNGPRRFCVEKWGKPTSLPRAHTCFNRLDLPPYMSFDMLYEKLLLAVEESSTFGIE